MKKLKQFLLSMLLLTCSIASYAYDFEVDGLYYNLLSASEKTCELVGCSESVSEVVIPDKVTVKSMTLVVKSMNKNAFAYNPLSLQSVGGASRRRQTLREKMFV